MAIDVIGGVGAMNVSTQTRVPKTQNVENIEVGTGVASGQVQVESLRPVSEKADSNNQKNQKNQKEQDRAGVQSDKEIQPEKVKSAVDDLNKQIKKNTSPLHGTQLSFKYHDETNRISITVTNSDTDEVIREIPPEKALDMLAKAWEMAGLLVDEKR